MLPNFLILGASKAGTTSLYHVLRQHPQVYMSGRKEVHFFTRERFYRRGSGFYARFFAGADERHAAVGEATPVYICHPEAPARIRQHLPDARLILVARHPVERAYSQYWYRRRDLTECLGFDRAMETDLEEEYQPGQRGYFSRGFYMRYLERYLRLFPRERILVLLFEDLQRDPAAFYRSCFEFLGVDPDFRCDAMERPYNRAHLWNNPVYNFLFHHPHHAACLPLAARRAFCWGPLRPYRYPAMPGPTRERLVRFYSGANRALEAFLGRSLEGWRV